MWVSCLPSVLIKWVRPKTNNVISVLRKYAAGKYSQQSRKKRKLGTNRHRKIIIVWQRLDADRQGRTEGDRLADLLKIALEYVYDYRGQWIRTCTQT